MSKAATLLRSRLAQPDIVVAPGAYDPLSARLIEQAGFSAVYMSGFGITAASAALPDLGLLTRSEFVDRLAAIARAVAVPVIADADTGFGNALQLERTMQLYEHAGAAALQLEDQGGDRRCGHLSGKAVIPTAEMLNKIRVMKSAQTCPDTLLIARTDARAVHGLDEALRRGEAYLAAGADVLFIEAPQSEAELLQVAQAFRGSCLMANMPEGGMTPYLPSDELGRMGYSLVIYPVVTLFPAVRAVQRALAELREHGRLVDRDRHIGFDEFVDLIGAPEYLARLTQLQSMQS